MYRERENIGLIIEGCKNKERKAQEQLYRNFHHSMKGLCMLYTKNEMDATAVLNEGFFKVFKNIHQYNPAKASLYTWIRAVVISTCLNHIKSSQNTIVANELQEVEDVQTEAEAILKMNADEILNLVRNLPATTQAVFNLYVMEGYGHKEIATQLQISEGTSKWHLSEARKKLKLQLEQENIQ